MTWEGADEMCTVAVTVTGAEAKALWSFSGMLQADPDSIRALWTRHPDPETVREMERELDDDPEETSRVIAAAASGFRKVFQATSKRFGPDARVGPHRLSEVAED